MGNMPADQQTDGQTDGRVGWRADRRIKILVPSTVVDPGFALGEPIGKKNLNLPFFFSMDRRYLFACSVCPV